MGEGSQRYRCADCAGSVSLGMAMCPGCGAVLTDDMRVPDRTPVVEIVLPKTLPDPPPSVGPECPECGVVQPRAGGLVCVDCMAELNPQKPAPAGGHRVELIFREGVVVIPAGPEVIIGRRGQNGSDQLLGGNRDVSRRHLSIRVSAQGRAQIRDDISVNGTFVNGQRLEGDWEDLPDNAHLRIGPSEVCRVRYRHS